MKKIIQFPYLVYFLILFLLCSNFEGNSQTWRSQLYPEDWQPVHEGGTPDDQGRFLHDFSYGGYAKGERDIPSSVGMVTIDVTQPPYSADNTGVQNVTAIIQTAIDDAIVQGGGTVYLPSGTYRLTTNLKDYCLRISESNVLLKGDGPSNTYLFIDQENMRKKTAILLGPTASAKSKIWTDAPATNTIPLFEDILLPTKNVKLTSLAGLNVGDWIMLRTDCTNAWAAEHGLLNEWGEKLTGIAYYRQIIAMDSGTSSIEIDIPTRYYLKLRDNARIYKLGTGHISNVGVTGFSIGQRRKSGSGFSQDDYTDINKAAYQIHDAHLIAFNHVVDGWLNEVETYRPVVNMQNSHMPSNGVLLFQSRNITVKDTQFSFPQYEGNGGNGYSYIHQGSDNIFSNSSANSSRHGFSLKSMWTSGNIIKDCSVNNNNRAADFHQHFSHANLVENFSGANFDADYRPYGTIEHAHTSSQNVIWRFRNSDNYRAESQQWGWGYVVGADNALISNPTRGDTIKDFEEGTGIGDDLIPQSLYDSQLQRRFNINPPPPTPLDSIVLTDDAYVRQGSGNANQSFASTLDLLVKDNGGSNTRRSYLRFDLSSINNPVSEAYLKLNVAGFGNEEVTQRPVDLKTVVNDNWNETSLTWNNRPAGDSTLVSFTVSDGDIGNYISLDVTDYFNSQIIGDKIASFLLTQPDGVDALVRFDSKESPNSPFIELGITQTPQDSIVPANLIQDAFVRGGNFSNDNYGTDSKLLVKDATSSLDRQSFLQFDLQPIGTSPVTQATLKLYVNSFGNEGVPVRLVDVFQVADDTWSENTITWNNKPISGTLVITEGLLQNQEGQYVSFDVTSYVNQEAQGDNSVTFMLKQPSGTNAAVNFSSKEGTNPPLLEIETTSPASLMVNLNPFIDEQIKLVGEFNLEVVPNPIQNEAVINFTATKENMSTLRIIDPTGQIIKSKEVILKEGRNTVLLDVSNLPSGLYFVQVLGVDGNHTLKIIVK